MPICTSCTHPTPYLYTVYQSAYNLRLEQCTACHAFADPYVEHDTLTLLLDLILLKRDVYRHLLFNRGIGARRVGQVGLRSADSSSQDEAQHQEDMPERTASEFTLEQSRAKARWWLIAKLGTALITMDAFIRWTHLSVSIPSSGSVENIVSWNLDAIQNFFRIFIGCFVETVAFHAGIVIACYAVLKCLDWAHSSGKPAGSRVSGIRQEFRYSHVPLTLLYSSLTKLFLLFLLSIWRPALTNHSTHSATSLTHPIIVNALNVLMRKRSIASGSCGMFWEAWPQGSDFEVTAIADRNCVDRLTVPALVVLDCHPFFTTTIILAGWAVKTMVAGLVGEWVGLGLEGQERSKGDMWLAYSIP